MTRAERQRFESKHEDSLKFLAEHKSALTKKALPEGQRLHSYNPIAFDCLNLADDIGGIVKKASDDRKEELADAVNHFREQRGYPFPITSSHVKKATEVKLYSEHLRTLVNDIRANNARFNDIGNYLKALSEGGSNAEVLDRLREADADVVGYDGKEIRKGGKNVRVFEVSELAAQKQNAELAINNSFSQLLKVLATGFNPDYKKDLV